MNLLAILLLAQLGAPARQTLPVLAFPEAGLDDSAAYQGYQTRFFRDAANNTVQIYVNRRDGRVVHLWADSENGSAGFTARNENGYPAILRWESRGADVASLGRARTLEYSLVADTRQLNLGRFLLGSMRVERDFQYWEKHREPFAAPPFVLPEMDRLFAALDKLDAAERRRHVTLLNADSEQTLRERLQPEISTRRMGSVWVARVVQRSLDGRDTMALEIRTDPARIVAMRAGDSVSLRARSDERVRFSVRISTTAQPLTPLARNEIFSAEFLAFLADAQRSGSGRTGDSASLRARWLERQVRGVELLSSREKLMAGLPAYATYFGRDMLLSALMMRPIWRDEMSEFVVAAALRKLSPLGQVSHEEALGGQAVREAAAEYAALIDDYVRAMRDGNRTAAEGRLARARVVLRDHRRVRENYNMIDDEFQLPIMAARWLADPDVPASRKRAFLFDTDGGKPRLERLIQELGLVARMTSAYAIDPVATNLVSFPGRDPTWASASWRDSGAGYAGGRFAMDVNAIWVPHALESIADILATLRTLGVSIDSLGRGLYDLRADMALGRYARDSAVLGAAIDTWWGASRHFVVRLGPTEVRSHVAARLAAMSDTERDHWNAVLGRTMAGRDSLEFLALSLDANGRPIAVANSDPATRLFLGDTRHGGGADALRDVSLFVRHYPVGLFIEGLGPVVANDAYAPPRVWREFERDRYHGPRVVWGREVNLFLLGVADRIAAASNPAEVLQLRDAINRVQAAVAASGFRSELWSYEVEDARLVPIRYGTGSDVQLWSTTDLAVQFALSRLERR